MSLLRRYGIWVALAVAFLLSLVPLVGYFAETPPITWTNSPFPTTNPVGPDTPLATHVERCSVAGRTVITMVARRLVDEETGAVTTLLPGAGIVEPGCTSQTGGIGIPPLCPEGLSEGCMIPGRAYHVDQYVQFPGRWRTHTVALRTQTFTVVGSDAP